MVCRNMGIHILPPDINEGEAGFSVSGNSIRHALTAIKNVGRPIIDAIVKERENHGKYNNLKDFIERTVSLDVNKRAIENFIKAGAFDSFQATRKQLMSVYAQIMENLQHGKRSMMEGQMSLFDIVSDEAKEELEIKMPDVGEYPKEMLLGFEKEVLGFYVSGHPLEEYMALWQKNITAKTADFYLDEETGRTLIEDGSKAVVGGMITDKKIKYTKNDKMMAFLVLEDLVGSIEVIVFPKVYESNAGKIVEDSKVFIKGRVSVEEDRDGKLICESITTFDEIPKKLWIKFPSLAAYEDKYEELLRTISESDGIDHVVIYIEETRQMKQLPANRNVHVDDALLETLNGLYGENNVKVVS